MKNLEQRFANAQHELEKQGRLDYDEISMVAARLSSSNLTAQAKVEAIEGLLKVQQLWSRKCDVTAKGMNEGFLVYDDMYIAEENDIVAELRKYYSDMSRPEVSQRYKDDAVRELAYEEDVFFFTEWYLVDEISNDNFYLELSSGDVVSWDDYLASF